MTADDLVEELMAANRAFYAALESLDLAAMSACWLQAEEACCVHPGWPLLRGWDAVEESWRGIFENTTYMKFGVADAWAVLDGAAGRVHCVENIFTLVADRQLHSRVAATNLFVRRSGAWKMVLHHGSAVAGSTSMSASGSDTEN